MDRRELDKTIKSAKKTLLDRAIIQGLFNRFSTKVFHIEKDNYVYVIVNPIIIDYENNIKRYNIQRWVRSWFEGKVFYFEAGLYPILIPYLIMRINIKNGIIEDSNPDNLKLEKSN